jgi:hypothetical protein
MSALVWPDLPGLDIAVERETEEPDVTVRRTVNRKEYRTLWPAPPVYHYKLKFNYLDQNTAAPAPFGTYNQVSVLSSFIDTVYGTWDTFSYTDPIDGTSRTVRFEQGTLKLKKLAEGMFEAQVQLVSVV